MPAVFVTVIDTNTYTDKYHPKFALVWSFGSINVNFDGTVGVGISLVGLLYRYF